MSLAGTSTVIAPILSRDTQAADQGIYYTAVSPTPGTGIVNTVNMTTLAIGELAPFLNVYNGGSATIYPLYLRLTRTVANAGNTTFGEMFTITVDQGNRVTTIPGATGVLAISNVNGGSPNKSLAQIYGNAAALVASAPTAQRRIVGSQRFRNGGVVGVIGDVFQFNFGSTEQIDPMSLVPTGTAICNVTYGFAPVVIGPNQSLGIVYWGTGQTTAPAFEVEFAYLEK
jgi:hypothetical protein